MKLYTSSQMATRLGITLGAFYTLRSRQNINYAEQIKGVNYFYESQFNTKIEKYYPLKTVETFYIYESKINKKNKL